MYHRVLQEIVFFLSLQWASQLKEIANVFKSPDLDTVDSVLTSRLSLTFGWKSPNPSTCPFLGTAYCLLHLDDRDTERHKILNWVRSLFQYYWLGKLNTVEDSQFWRSVRLKPWCQHMVKTLHAAMNMVESHEGLSIREKGWDSSHASIRSFPPEVAHFQDSRIHPSVLLDPLS